LEVRDALAPQLLCELRIANGERAHRASLRSVKARGGRGESHMVGKPEPTARGFEGPDHLTMGDRGVPGVNVEVGRVLEPDGPDGDHEVAQGNLRLERSG